MAEGNGLLNRHTGDFPYRGFESLPLRINLNPANAGFLIYTEGVKQTALLHVGIRKAERCFCLRWFSTERQKPRARAGENFVRNFTEAESLPLRFFASNFGKFFCLCSLGYFGLRPFTVYSRLQSPSNFAQTFRKKFCSVLLSKISVRKMTEGRILPKI